MTSGLVSEIDFRPARTWDDYVQCEEVQRQVWHMSDWRDIVPAHLLITANKNGGLLLGAFDGARLVGFVFGFLGIEEGLSSRRLKHCSHLLAVLPAYQASGLGLELKRRQRQHLLEQGITLATWTYDPLQVINAMLNLSRLGALARRYLRDAYGEMLDGLNVGVASDRFEVEWWLESPRVRDRLEPPRAEARPSQAQPIYQVEFDKDGLPRVVDVAECQESTALVQVPWDYNALKRLDLYLARAWREQTRATFETAFAIGYTASDVAQWRDEQGRRHAGYILEKLI